MNELTHYRCVQTDVTTQEWGESKACVKVDPSNNIRQPMELVSKRSNVCPVGYKDFYRSIGMLFHNGVDRECFFREPVYFDTNYEGWMKTEVDNAGGIGVDVISNEPLVQCTEPNCKEKHHIKRRYWHFERVIGHDGKKIKIGDAIGLGDSTGASSGNHVHEGTKWCDKNGRGLHTNNGTYGAFNMLDPKIGGQYHNIFVRDILGLSPERLDTAQKLSKTVHIFQLALRSVLGKRN